jgi:hypothetical protein
VYHLAGILNIGFCNLGSLLLKVFLFQITVTISMHFIILLIATFPLVLKTTESHFQSTGHQAVPAPLPIVNRDNEDAWAKVGIFFYLNENTQLVTII